MTNSAETNTAPFRRRLATIRHNLRTPAGHILGYSEMLVEDLEEDDPNSEILPDLKRIHSAGERLIELIDELLGASKTSAEQVDIPFTQHQIRIQLNHISGYCDILREDVPAKQREALMPDLDRIASAAETFLSTMEHRLRPSAFLETEEPTSSKVQSPHKATNALSSDQTTSLSEGGRILIVDDDEANRNLLERRLRRQGYETTSVSDGHAALEFLKSEPADIILLDMMMPGLSGMEVLQKLKDDRSLRRIPVIMLSALDDMDQIVQAILAGAEDYLLKPFNPVLLRARIGASLEKCRLRQAQVPKLKVFISSPGDVIPERQIVKHALAQLNEEFSGQVYLVPILWEEEPLLASETFQSQILPPSDTDIYIGIFWSRLGTQLPENIRRPDGTRYGSGSEFEFEDAMEGFKKNGSPAILTYKKTTEPTVPLSNRQEILDRLDQMEKLEDFIRRWFLSDDGECYTAAYHAFASPEQFEDQVTSHLRKLVLKRLAASS